MSRCRTCAAPIEWGVTDHGRRMPLDPGLWPDGRIVPVGEYRDDAGRSSMLVVVLTGDQVERLKAAGDRVAVKLRRSHFQTCPDANEWRQP